MDAFVEKLAEICRAHPTAEKWVVLPPLSVGLAIGERLARAGRAWINLRFTTPAQIAEGLAGPRLVALGVGRLPEDVGPALVSRLLQGLGGGGKRYFSQMGDDPGTGRILWATIREMRLAGVRSGDLRTDALVAPAKSEELKDLLAAYEAFLSAAKLADTATIFTEATAELARQAPADGRFVLTPDTAGWSPLERALIERMPGRHIVLPHSVPHGLPSPEPSGATEGDPLRGHAGDVRPARDSERLAWLFAPEAAPPPAGDASVSLFHAAGHDSEVEEVLRRVLASGAPLDQVEVACARTEPYVTLLCEAARRLGIPMTFGPGLPVTVTRPGRALVGFCRWVEGDFPAGVLRRFLQSGDLTLGDEGLSPGGAARLLLRSGIAWGRDMYAPGFRRLQASLEEAAREAEAEGDTARAAGRRERAGQLARLEGILAGVFTLVPAPSAAGRVDLATFAAACREWVGRYARVADPLDGAAREALQDALDALAALPPAQASLAHAIAQVRALVEDLRVGAERARPGHLHVAGVSTMGWAGREHTFVVGLDQGSFPGVALQDPVLLDVERRRVHAGLPQAADRVADALHAGASRLASLSGRVTLSCATRDAREDRGLYPSSVLLQALRLSRPGRALTYEDLQRGLGEPATRVPKRPEEALDEAGWWTAGIRDAGHRARPALVQAYPALARGDEAERAREAEVFTPFDGLVHAAAGALDPRRGTSGISATALEELATCPHRFFLRRGLGIAPLDEAEADRYAWLDPMARGSLLHDVYARFLRALRDRGERPDPARHRDEVRGLAEEALAAYRAEIPPPSGLVFAREREEILRDLEVFLHLSAAEKDRDPVAFEVSFGLGAAEAAEPLSQADPVVVDPGDGPRFPLRGRIDRIDRLAPHTYAVVDYKTGWLWGDDRLNATLAGGKQLQHALYALAAGALLRKQDRDARIARAEYVFPTVRGRGEPVARPPDGGPDFQAVLRLLFRLLEEGVFPHAADEKECGRCDFRGACGHEPWRRAEAKKADPANAALEPVRELEQYA
jgi:ATP-dependent helicase/nuclease subunit B